MTAVSAIAEKPERVEKMFLNTLNAIEAKGIYGVNMYALGVPHTIIVDDYIPMYEGGGNVFAGIPDDKSVWGAIIEKAFAKLYGNYYHVEAGTATMAARTLIGGPWEEFEHTDYKG